MVLRDGKRQNGSFGKNQEDRGTKEQVQGAGRQGEGFKRCVHPGEQ